MNKYTSPVYFLSDCHLPLIVKPGQESWTPTVVNFLRKKASRAKTLFLVGDIFDFWFEWRHSIPGAAFPVLVELNKFAQQGVEIIYMAGNHDGHIGKFLEDKVGLTTTRKPIDAEIDGSKFHILHGDGIAQDDRGYRILRSLVRWKPTEAIYKLIHPDFGIWFANKVSKYSRVTGGNRKAVGLKQYHEYAERKLNEGFNYVIMGHVHECAVFDHKNGGYYAIGDWIGKHGYGVFENGEMTLEFFKDT